MLQASSAGLGRMEALRVVAAVALLGSCMPSGNPCYPGDYIACGCDNGIKGYARCNADGKAYAACDCSGQSPLGGAPAADAGATDASSDKLGLIAACDNDAQCASGLCFLFNAKGPKCTLRCSVDSDCPPPTAGCNNMGVCKAP